MTGVWRLERDGFDFAVAAVARRVYAAETESAQRPLGARDTLLAQLRSFTDDYLRCFRNGVPPRSQRKQVRCWDWMRASLGKG
jgi:hypothetical protein